MITVQPDAWLVTAEADTPLDILYEALRAYGLWLPIVPLVQGQTLEDLVRCNAGGRYRLKYGPMANYLRGATLSLPSSSAGVVPMVTGGATMKRATGYRLPQSFVGAPPPGPLHQITFRVVPFPQARRALLFVCPNMHTANRFAATLLHQMNPTALALAASLPRGRGSLKTPLLLVGLEGLAPVMQRQTNEAIVLARQEQTTLITTSGYDAPDDAKGEFGLACWQIWEHIAEQWDQETPYQSLSLDMTWSRSLLNSIITQARTLAAYHRLSLSLWGDIGVGTLHMKLDSESLTPGEIQQSWNSFAFLGKQWGGIWSTERGTTPPGYTVAPHNNSYSGIQKPADHSFSPASPPAPRSALLSSLHQIVGSPYVLSQPDELVCYARDASIAQSSGEPLVVVFPSSTDEVSHLVRLAASNRISLIPRGAGSGLAGGSVPSEGAIIIAFSRMQKMHIDPIQQWARVQAGVVTGDLQQAAEHYKLCYPPDPSSQSVSTIGGNIACNAGGPHCLKYGVTADYVIALTAVLADGKVVTVGDDSIGQSPDAGLMHLLIGSEGTLALITEATVRLIRKPTTQQTIIAFFDTVAQAGATVQAIMAAGLVPATLELMDNTAIGVVEAYIPQGLPPEAGAMLLLQLDGEPEAVEWEARMGDDLMRAGGGWGQRWARNATEEKTIWAARRAVGPALARVAPNKLGEDIAVPIPRIAEAIERIQAIATRNNVTIPIFGHAGDGNLHPNILFDAKKPGETERTWQVAGEIVQVALDLGGTLSGEHGIGLLKRPFLAAALGEPLLAWQQAIKATYDPLGIMNPGKLFPVTPGLQTTSN